ncbi:hypothetical protein Pmani_016215 [Petrolisthes manimaculis]|uniref:Battenin n=1 Tax=Petrolisthes manimaculis TaxID=1843537 RepID=A0AAE1UAS9_9EUCA|nr:hypothetical protein Pmani_016215 [Petrolisthes manimaculis]
MAEYRPLVANSDSDSEDYESAVETTPMQSQNSYTDQSRGGGGEGEGGAGGEDNNNKEGRRKEKWQNLAAYWFLGLTNNFAYVVMLSAAHDILSRNFTPHDHVMYGNGTSNNTNPRDCNIMSTGAILLADIIPSLVIKIIAPFFVLHVHFRVSLVVVLGSASFLLVGLATSRMMAIFGVICAAAGAGLGETTLLAYSANFHRDVVSTWSSGTGGAGVFGAISYAGLTSAGLTPRSTVLLMLIVPAIMGLSFWVLLQHPDQTKCFRRCMRGNGRQEEEEEERSILDTTDLHPSLSFRQKMSVVPSLLKYMVPVALVYVAEYVINQGLMELIYFPDDNAWLNHHEQYRWYQVMYQVGVLVSRSSVNCFTIYHIWKMSVLQWLNLVLFLTCAIYWWISSIWLVFLLIFWEGLLGGAAYVNTFYRISQEVDINHKEFAMGITSMSDSLGVTLAGFIAIPLHNVICKLPV